MKIWLEIYIFDEYMYVALGIYIILGFATIEYMYI